MASQSIFAQEWHDSLRAHFLYVIQINDEVTEPTLREVLREAGIPQEEIDEWYAEGLRLREQHASEAVQ
jgi:hypothetical protein